MDYKIRLAFMAVNMFQHVVKLKSTYCSLNVWIVENVELCEMMLVDLEQTKISFVNTHVVFFLCKQINLLALDLFKQHLQ